MPRTAVQEYRARLDARCATRDALTAADARLAYARLATFFSGVVFAAVEEFASALNLREQLALAGADRAVTVNTERLLDWAEAPMPSRRTLRGVIWFFTTCILFASLYLAVTSVWWPLSAVLVLHTVALLRLRDDMNTILSTREPHIAADFVLSDAEGLSTV